MRALLLSIIPLIFYGCVPISSGEVDFHKRTEAEKLIADGVLRMRQRDLLGAKAAFTLAYEIAPIPEALDGLGCVAFLSGDPVEARAKYRAALVMDPEYAEARANLALLEEIQGRKTSANELYRDALEVAPANPKFRNNYAGFLHANGYSDEAKRELRKASVLGESAIVFENEKRSKSW